MKMVFMRSVCIGTAAFISTLCAAGGLEVAEADFTVSSCDNLIRDYPVALDLTYAEGGV